MRHTWRKPKPTAILILDAAGSDLIKGLCGNWPTQVLDRERLSIPILFSMLIRGHKSMREYQNAYIRKTDPQIIITLIDNDMYFLTIKNTFPSITTIAIQNGIRANYSPSAQHGFFTLLAKSDSPSCDYYCVFNDHVGTQLSRLVKTDPVTTGSIRNNEFRSKSTRNQSISVAFVSQHPPRSIPNSSGGIYFDDTLVPDRKFYEADVLVANYLARVCGQRGFEFTVCGKRDSNFSHEFELFSEAIGEYRWNYAPRTSETSTYETLDDAKLIITVDSTIGYEFLARGNRTAFFSVRGALISDFVGRRIEELDFGWPLKMEPRGSFWTDTPSDAEFDRILDYLTSVSNEEWTREIDKYNKDVMVFDRGNTVLRELIQRLGANLIDHGSSHA